MSIGGILIYVVATIIFIIPSVVEIINYIRHLKKSSYAENVEEKLKRSKLWLAIKVVFVLLSLMSMILIGKVQNVKSFYLPYAWIYALICSLEVIIMTNKTAKYNFTYKTALWIVYITIIAITIAFFASIVLTAVYFFV